MPQIDRYQRLLEQRTTFEKLAQARSTSFAAKAASTENYDYIVDSMQPIDPAYTQRTFDEAERVRSQLANGLDSGYLATFDYQGSVTSDTHIRTYSDIDLLSMDGRIVSLDVGAPNLYPYKGSVVNDLVAFRNANASVLRQKFPQVTVDNKPGKAIALSGGSLQRKIDVVAGNWWDTQAYESTKQKRNRGIAVIDTKVPEQVRNLPFMHNYRIDEKDKKTSGLRKAIRFLKSAKYAAVVKFSSYDVTSVAWNMPDSALIVEPGDYLGLASKVTDELNLLINNSAKRDSLLVPNGTRKVFGAGAATLEGLKALYTEANDIVVKAKMEKAARLYHFSEANRQGYGSQRGMDKHAWVETLPASVKAHMY